MTPEALAAVKQALEVPAPAPGGLPADGEIMSNIGKMMLAAGGLGLGARGLLGLNQTMKRTAKPTQAFSPGMIPVSVPLPEEEEDPAKFAWTFSGAGESLSDGIGQAITGVGDWLKGPGPTSVAGKGWPIPVATLGGMGAMYGGWKAMDGALNSRRDSELEAEKERAKQELHQALLSQFGHKTAGVSELSDDLDKLYDLLEKEALNRSDMTGIGMGVAGTGALLSALAAGMAAYKHTKSRLPGALTDKATKLRNRRLANMQPSPLLAMPSYSPVPAVASL